MADITINLPKKLIARVEKHYPNIDWPDTIRRIIVQKLDELEKANTIRKDMQKQTEIEARAVRLQRKGRKKIPAKTTGCRKASGSRKSVQFN